MANSKIYLGSTNIGSLFQGADDISIYLWENKVYPLAEPTFKWKATYQDSHVESAQCDSSSAITQSEIQPINAVSVEIGDCVTSIGSYIFSMCTSLRSVNIGSGLTSFGDFAFEECYGLTSITVNAIVPPRFAIGVFNNTNNCPIYVPCESVNTYKSASGWSTYASRIQAIPNSCPKFYATYSGGETYELDCDGNTTLNTTNTKPTGYEYSAMTEAIIGDCVTTINGRILWGCTSLSSVTIPDTVTSIGTYAFYDCSSLTSIDIPSGVTSIANGTFESCISLTSVTIPDTVTSIGDGAFYSCSGLTSIVIPDSVTSIGSQSFSYCSSLSSVDIPSGVTSIGNSAFQYCSSLTSIVCLATVPPTLGGATVFNNTNDCPIIVPCESVNAYKSASGWSNYASRITCVQPPFEGKWVATYSDSHVESAECGSSSAITENEINLANLVSVEIGDCVTSIDECCFDGCSSLTSCTIGDSVTTIGMLAFNGCDSLTSIDIPDNVTSIGNSAFKYCSSLSSITIPDSVTSIGGSAFNGCSSLTSITVNATTPPTLLGWGVFDDTNDCPIYVPSASLHTYQIADEWSDYDSRIQAIP